MRFAFDARTGSSGKLHARVAVPLALRMKPSWLSFSPSAAGATAAGLRDRTRPPRREYRLVATVSHHGRGAARGHYTAAVRLRDRRKAEEEEGEAWKNKNTKKGVSFRSPLVEAGRRKELPGSSRWLSFDDDRVREVCEDEVTNGEAYLLFYELN